MLNNVYFTLIYLGYNIYNLRSIWFGIDPSHISEQYRFFYCFSIFRIQAGGFSDSAKNKDIYIIDNISGFKIKVNQSYIPKEGDIIFIEETLGFKNWKRFTETVKLASTLSTMLASIVNILWIADRISE